MRRDSRKFRNQKTKANMQKVKYEKSSKKRLKLLSVFVLVAFIIFMIVFVYNKFIVKNNTSDNNELSLYNSENNKNNTEELKEKEEEKKDTTFTITALGDVLCHNTQYWDAYDKETGKYDFTYVFDDINLYTKTGDFCIANLETSFAGEERGYSNYPTFNSPDALAYSLKKIGVDMITTAGNHCLDMGFTGLSRTIDVLDDADIKHMGTYKTKEDRDKVFTTYIKDVKVAFINYTYGTNGIPVPSDKPYCVNLIDKELIKKDIEAAKKEGYDMLVACMHWGTEYRLTPTDEQEDLADFLFQNGVDVILGNHPHVLEPMEKRTVTLEDGTKKECFVIYALGNFTADQNYENTRNSIILNLTITKHWDGKLSIDKAKYIPIYMYKNPNKSIKKFKVLDIEKTIENYYSGVDTSIGQTMYSYLQKQLETIKKVVGDPIGE